MHLRKKKNDAANDLWRQVFAGLAQREDAAIWDPAYDPSGDRQALAEGFRQAGWSEVEIELRLNAHDDHVARAPEPGSGVNPGAQVIYGDLCADVEAAMERLGLRSHDTIALGIEPRVGPFASKMNVIMTDESIVTVGAHLFRFCGLIARAFARTLFLNPYFWSCEDYTEKEGRACLFNEPKVMHYWLRIYLSYAVTGTHALVPFKPARRHEALLFEQIARAMEIFAISHEYGHHHYNHGRQITEHAAHAEEHEADQFALRVSAEVERLPILFANPYLPSGAGGTILLIAMRTLRYTEDRIVGPRKAISDTHPDALERIGRFDSIAILEPTEFKRLKDFRTTAVRIMSLVETCALEAMATADFRALSELSAWKFAER